MHFFKPLLFLLVILNFQTVKSQDLKDYRWKNRILLLVDQSLATKNLNEQLQALLEDEKALKDRNLLIFLVTQDTVYTVTGESTEMNSDTLRKSFEVPPNFKGTLLIGKDGGLKLKKGFLVAPKTIFDLIDSMPMRRAEMRGSEKP